MRDRPRPVSAAPGAALFTYRPVGYNWNRIWKAQGERAIIQGFVSEYGYMAVAIMLLLDSLGIPLPTEASLLLTGAMIKKGALFAPYVLGVALTAAAAGSAASYWIGRRMGSRAFNTLIRLFRVPTERTSQIEESFRRHRNRAVFVARFIPFVRCLIGYPAGMAGLPFGDYMFYSLLGYGAWLTLSLLAGYGGFALLHILDLPWKTMAVGAAAAVIVWFALRTIGRPRRI